jgi:hypothetical protein
VADQPTRGRPSESGESRAARRRALDRPKLIDRILDYPYSRLFGLKGKLVIVAIVLIGLVVKFVTGINTVTVDPTTCELGWADEIYRVTHKQRVVANSQRELGRLTGEKQTVLWAIQAGRDPFPSKAGGNVARIQRIDKDKFFWRSYAGNLEKDLAAISACLQRLSTSGID